jgi:hypothetical protein
MKDFKKESYVVVIIQACVNPNLLFSRLKASDSNKYGHQE